MFLHFGIEHLFGNMLTLIFLGDLLEKMIGKFRFILIYFLGGTAGNLLSLAKEMITGNYAISAGASGAIFAVVGALVFLVVQPSGKTPGDQRPAPGSYGASDAGRWFRVNRCGLYGALGRYGSRLCAGGDTGRKTETEGRSLFPGRISDVTAVSSGRPAEPAGDQGRYRSSCG